MTTYYPGGIISATEDRSTSNVASGMWSLTTHMQNLKGGIWPATSVPVNQVNAISLLVAGGGGGGTNYGGGGGAGGLIYNTVTPILTGVNYSVVIGAGGAAIAQGSNTTFGILSQTTQYTAVGGGYGGYNTGTTAAAAGSGGSGGGGGSGTSTIGTIGFGTAGQGSNGGLGIAQGSPYTGGGGGSANNGAAANTTSSGAGGSGNSFNFANGTSVFYAGGGGGGGNISSGAGAASSGGGGAGATGAGGTGTAGTANLGGGGGGGATTSGPGGAGGSGVAIISYPLPQQWTGGTVTNNNANVVHTFKTSSTLTALSTPIDTYQPYTTLLLHGEGTKGSNTSTFLDGATQQPYVPFAGTYSYVFNPPGTASAYLTSTTSATYQMTGDFTIEFWFYATYTIQGGLVNINSAAGNSTSGLSIYLNSSTNKIGFFVNGNQGSTTSANNTVLAGQWYHVALVRATSTNTLYLNGASVASNATTPAASATPLIGIGRVYNDGTTASDIFNGYISNVRIVKGQALYTGTFTPATSALTSSAVGTSGVNVAASLSGTVIALTAQNYNIIDNSPTPVTFTNTTGATSLSVGTTPGYAYVPSSNMYSNYFNGIGSYLTTPYSTTNFNWYDNALGYAIECWVYPTSNASLGRASGTVWQPNIIGNMVYNTTSQYWSFGLNGYLQACFNYSTSVNANTGANSVSGASLNSWNHIAMTSNTTAYYLYMNGVQNGPFTFSGATSSTTPALTIGAFNSSYFSGYISNLRIIKGTNAYSASFTPSYTSLTANSVTNLLIAGSSTNIDTSTVNNIITNNGQMVISSGGNPIARYGNTSFATFSPFSTSGWSNYFPSTSEFITTAVSSNFAFAGTFTIEFFIYLTAVPTTNAPLAGATNSGSIVVYYSTAGYLSAALNGSATMIIESTYSFANNLNTWHHVTVARGAANAMNIWVDGTSYGTGSNTQSFTASAGFKIGSALTAGYMSNLKVSNTDIYGVTNTRINVPISALTADSTTMLLTCQANKFKDSSTSALALTVSGTPQVQPFSPFSPTAAYSNTNVGGSLYFGGNDNSTANTPASIIYTSGYSDQTIDLWVYITSATRGDIFWVSSPTLGRFGIYYDGTNYVYYESVVKITSASNNTINSWHHIALTRASNTVSMYVDGIRVGTNTTSGNWSSLDHSIYLGKDSGGSTYLYGYIKDFRYIKNQSIYSGTTLTVPTAPLTSTGNTVFLLNTTNPSSIIDSTQKNIILTTGANTAISNNVSKFGSSSIAFNGTTDYISVIDSPNIRAGAGDFTIEGWFYINALGAIRGLVSKGPTAATTGWEVRITAGNVLAATYSATALTGITSVLTNTWYHFAMVRYGTGTGNIKLYLNGGQEASSATGITTDFSETDNMRIGNVRALNGFFNGYIDEVRFTKGYARYITTFTPSTTSFLDT